MDQERLYRMIAENAPALIWISGPDQQRVYLNKRWLDFTGRLAESELGNGWMQGIHPDDLSRLRDTYSESFLAHGEFRLEYRLRRHDGAYRWICETGAPLFADDGSFAGCIGSCTDVTESRLESNALAQSNARLLHAQEQERTRIARELHDDIGSSLSILGIEMLRAGQPVSGSPERKHPGIPEIYRKVQNIASRVSRLSHQLHSPELEYFGLAKAIETECRTFSDTRRMPVACSCKNLPAKPNPFVALSFLRVVQEALHNAAKHSRAQGIDVEALVDGSEIILQISDDGVGFDVEQSRLAAGLGLISMRERIRLIGGSFELWSEPGKGTRIRCRVPLSSSQTEPVVIP
jgi:PAS domain S-box-containing protein